MHTPILYLCWLCGEAVDLRTCKIDEYGETVHEACHTARLMLESGTCKSPASVTHSESNSITMASAFMG